MSQNYSNQDESDKSVNENVEDMSHDLNNLSIEGGDFMFEENQNIDNEVDTKTISMQEYEDLVQLIPKFERLKCTIRMMEDDIKSKRAEIEELREFSKREQKRENSYSHLTAVSIFYSGRNPKIFIFLLHLFLNASQLVTFDNPMVILV